MELDHGLLAGPGKVARRLWQDLPAVVRSEEGRWPGGSFELQLQPDLPPVAGDATYVEQVVRNLLRTCRDRRLRTPHRT